MPDPTTADRLEYLVLHVWIEEDITEGLAVWSLGVDRLEARRRKMLIQRLETDEAVREMVKASINGGANWRDEAVRRYVEARAGGVG